MGKSQRQKGQRGERWVANRWRDSGLYPDAKRGAQQSRAGDTMADVEGTPWWVEVKTGKQVPKFVYSSIEQAEEATDGRPVIVVAKRDRQDAVVIMKLDTFEEFVRDQNR